MQPSPLRPTDRLPRQCLTCGHPFQARVRDVERGYGNYCSRRCTDNRTRPPRPPNCACACCGAPLYRPPGKRAASKSGLMFCNRACKERAQGAEGGLFPPPNYKTGAASYRTRALRVTQACQECGFGAVPEVLEVHHIDHNRGNNGLENLRVLCPTCHAIAHFRAGTGKYGPKH